MKGLNSKTIAKLYTTEQIQEKVNLYEKLLESSSQGGYSLNTSQSSQSGTPANMQDVEKVLAIYLDALAIKKGVKCNTTITAINYTP